MPRTRNTSDYSYSAQYPDEDEPEPTDAATTDENSDLKSITFLLTTVRQMNAEQAESIAEFTVNFCQQDESAGLELLASFFQPENSPSWTQKENQELLHLTFHCYQDTAQQLNAESANYLADQIVTALAHTTFPRSQKDQYTREPNLSYAQGIKQALSDKDLPAFQNQTKAFYNHQRQSNQDTQEQAFEENQEGTEQYQTAGVQTHFNEHYKKPAFDLNELLTFNVQEMDPLTSMNAAIAIAQGSRDLRENTDWQPRHREYQETEAEIYHWSLIESNRQSASSLLTMALDHAEPQTRQAFLQELTENNTSTAQWTSQSIDQFMQLQMNEARRDYTSRYGFPIVTRKAIDWIKETVKDTNLLEIGAGNGYLATELQNQGFQVNATEPHPAGPANDYAINPRQEGIQPEQYDGLQSLDKYPGVNLLWSWPQAEDYTADILLNFSGRHFIYIGEPASGQPERPESGATGGNRFHQVLQERFELVDKYYIPTFPNIYDSIYIYERKE